MDTEVREILDCIEENSKSKGGVVLIAGTLTEKIVALGCLVSVVLLLSLIHFTATQEFALVCGVVFLLFAIAYVLVSGQKIIGDFVNPLNGYADILEKDIHEKQLFICRLSKFPCQSLELVVNGIDSHVSSIQSRLVILVGAASKTGFIPAGFALYFTATKVLSGADYFPAFLMMSLVFGMYIGVLFGYRMIGILERNLECLKEALEIARRKQRLNP